MRETYDELMNAPSPRVSACSDLTTKIVTVTINCRNGQQFHQEMTQDAYNRIMQAAKED